MRLCDSKASQENYGTKDMIIRHSHLKGVLSLVRFLPLNFIDEKENFQIYEAFRGG
jgi:hypothetical protein